MELQKGCNYSTIQTKFYKTLYFPILPCVRFPKRRGMDGSAQNLCPRSAAPKSTASMLAFKNGIFFSSTILLESSSVSSCRKPLRDSLHSSKGAVFGAVGRASMDRIIGLMSARCDQQMAKRAAFSPRLTWIPGLRICTLQTGRPVLPQVSLTLTKGPAKSSANPKTSIGAALSTTRASAVPKTRMRQSGPRISILAPEVLPQGGALRSKHIALERP